MALINFKNVDFSFGEVPLLSKANFSIDNRERVAVLGRNGAGKSTLLKLIEGHLYADNGDIERKSGITIAKMAQAVPQDLNGTVLNFVLSKQQQQEDWQSEHQSQMVISQLGLNPDADLASLSGGQVRRALLAQALVNQPDMLLLDEPTNHLDIDSIIWLEGFLQQYPRTIITITHDRVFMQKIANRILELDRGQVIDWEGSYDGFVKHKAQQLHAEEIANQNFDKKLSQEETWIRQGIKARRTRNEGRVRALKAMRQERAARNERQGSARLQQQKSDASGKQVFEVNNLSVAYAGKTIIDDFSCLIQRGDKIGIIGPNGCGKSTLLAALLQELTPDSGEVIHGTKLDIAYFDQHRSVLDPESMVIDGLGLGRDFVEIGDKRKHVIGYLQDFLFTPEKSRGKIKSLSGGENNRLMLARIFAKPSNVLILDEPTNDLDQETLELLEEYLLDYKGTVLIVSHDRALLNNVVTSTIVFEGQGKVAEYVGGYDDWLRQRKQSKAEAADTVKPKAKKANNKKLSYKEQRELDQLPEKINQLEQSIDDLQQVMSQSDFYSQDADVITKEQAKMTDLNEQLEQAYARWEELEAMR